MPKEIRTRQLVDAILFELTRSVTAKRNGSTLFDRIVQLNRVSCLELFPKP